eukprot:315566_1
MRHKTIKFKLSVPNRVHIFTYHKAMGAAKSHTNITLTKAVIFRKDTVNELYDFGETLGKGTFGSVHRCFRKSDSVEFAVKVVDKRYLSDKERNHLRREIEILNDIRHDNIIKVINVFVEGISYLLFWNYVKNRTYLIELFHLKTKNSLKKNLLK